jgi:hypothetical protein
MNELNLNLQHSIVALSAKGSSRRRIARELEITDIAQFTPAAWAKIHNTTAPI